MKHSAHAIPVRLWLTVALLLALSAAFGTYVHFERNVDRANERRYHSYQLIELLRRSSDELTRMARTYVVTGEPRYKTYYDHILAIREGKLPRPENYFHAYWDTVLADAEVRSGAGESGVPLLAKLRQAGFSEGELAKLVEAKGKSDSLTAMERRAMQLAEAAGADAEAKRSQARAMLFDTGYHRAKADIMKSINDCYQSLDRRTFEAVRAAEQSALLWRLISIAAALATVFMLWRAYAAMRATLGGTADDVRKEMQRIGRGDFSTPIKLGPDAENSVMAGLSELQNKLFMLEAGRGRADESLRASAERLREAQRIAHLGSWHLDIPSGELAWSDEVYRLFEIDRNQSGTTYKAFLRAIHPDDRAGLERVYRESIAKRAPFEITHRLRMPDGRVKWVHERGATEFDGYGKPLRSFGTVQDVSERMAAEDQLRVAATVFDAQEGIVVTDADGIILRVNRAFSETTGFSAAELIGKTPGVFQSVGEHRHLDREMQRSIQRTGGWQGEIWGRRKNGEKYPKWLSISAVKDGSGAITHYVRMHLDISERKQAQEKITELAFFDQLTGLPNRTLLLDRLKQVMTACSRSGSHGALLIIDLDNFKMLNDTLGHEIGDALLKQASRRLGGCIRESDTCARVGGDEFVAVLTDLGHEQEAAASATEAIARKMLAALRESYQLGDVAHQGTASIGATLFRGRDATVDELMKQADLAMYKSKSAGRNAFHFFDPATEATVRQRAALEGDLRSALQEGQFQLHYQVQVADASNAIGAEALIRWQHPQRGMVSPADFIPLAEETGVILPLGRWVMETACRQLAAWSAMPEMAHLTIAVNVSVVQFRQPDFVKQVLSVIEATGADPNRLKLELTESLLAENVVDIADKMFALKAKGVGFALDDFGTGYSSLSYLKRLPFDQLKIDRSFVRDILVDPNDAAIARTIAALAQSLGFGVIAEGVETVQQRDLLARSGCHAYQGYLFGRPLPLQEFEHFVQRI